MKSELIENRIIVWNIEDSKKLFSEGYYGKPIGMPKPKIEEIDVPLILDLIEGYYLLEMKKITITKLKQKIKTIEREIDIKYRDATIKLLNEVKDPKELLLIKDVIEGIEEMSDKCQRVSDSFILLALSL